MLSPLHEMLVERLRRSPELLCHFLGDQLPPIAKAGVRFSTDHNRGSNLIEVGNDLVIKVRNRRGKLLCALVIEVQLSRKKAKTRTWALYAAWVHYRLRCPVHVVVLALDDAVAKWAAGPFCIGDMTLTPWVIGPENIEPITSVTQARRSLDMAFLSGMAHRDHPVAQAVGRALFGALGSSNDEHAGLMWDIFVSSVDKAVRRSLEMELGDWVPQSDWGKKIFAEGKAKGRKEGKAKGLRAGKAEGLKAGKAEGLRAGKAEGLRAGKAEGLRAGKAEGLRAGKAEGLRAGKAEGEAQALLLLLKTRGVRLTETQRKRVRSCGGVRQLRTWIRRAVTAATAAEVFDAR